MKTQPRVAERHAILTPRQIFEYLDRYVVGQERAKRTIAIAAYNHLKRCAQKTVAGKRLLKKSNVLLVGPTGSGKTHLARTLAQCLEVPFAVADATEYTEAGYYGKDVEVMIGELLHRADQDVELAQRGIIFIDEVDKIARRSQGARTGAGTRDIGGEGVQQSLLKLLEGREVFAPLNVTQHWNKHDFVVVDTQDILFIAAGTFGDLRLADEPKAVGFGAAGEAGVGVGVGVHMASRRVTEKELLDYGLLAEFLGRVPVRVEGLETLLGRRPALDHDGPARLGRARVSGAPQGGRRRPALLRRGAARDRELLHPAQDGRAQLAYTHRGDLPRRHVRCTGAEGRDLRDRRALRGGAPRAPRRRHRQGRARRRQDGPRRPPGGVVRIGKLFGGGKRVFSFEFFPPKTEPGVLALERTIRELSDLEPAFVSVTYGAGGSTRGKTIDLVQWIQREAHITAMAHLTCVGATKEEIGGVLDRLTSAGIENIMALRGDPPAGQETFVRTEGGFGYANDLVGFIRSRHGDQVRGRRRLPRRRANTSSAATSTATSPTSRTSSPRASTSS